MPTSTQSAAKRDVTISVRARAGQGELIGRAAAQLGMSRSDFTLAAACHEAELVILDQRLFPLDAPTWRKFLAILDAPPRLNEGLRDLMAAKAPWER